MPDPVKVSTCGFVVKIDTGSGFITQGLVDSITPFTKSKVVIDTPVLDCKGNAEVGSEETSQMSFVQYYDPQRASDLALDTNFEDSIDDPDLRDVTVHIVSGLYDSTGSQKAVTLEATCQIVSLIQEELTPQGMWKRTVTLVRKSDVTITF